MDVQEYINEECKRLKQDLMKEFDAIITPMESSLQKISNDLLALESLTSSAYLHRLLQKKE